MVGSEVRKLPRLRKAGARLLWVWLNLQLLAEQAAAAGGEPSLQLPKPGVLANVAVWQRLGRASSFYPLFCGTLLFRGYERPYKVEMVIPHPV